MKLIRTLNPLLAIAIGIQRIIDGSIMDGILFISYGLTLICYNEELKLLKGKEK